VEELFSSGRVVDIALAALAIEAAVLVVIHRRRGRGLSWQALWPNLLAGAGLLLALRGALTGAHWSGVALALLVAVVANLLDLRARARRGR
jgi:pheromone shutdown protein TraB